jgi:hypothetical protein
MLDLAVPILLPDNDCSSCRFRDLDRLLPIACLPEEGKAIDEDKRRDSTLKSLEALREVVVIIMCYEKAC